MTSLKRITDEVYIAEDRIVQVSRESLEMFQLQAARNSRHRARLCAHKSPDDRINEMFIALTNAVYIRPHKHFNKSESFHVIEGAAIVIFFDDAGKIEEVIEIGDYQSGKPFYYRNEDNRFHTQIVTSETLVFHEITNGPFSCADTILAPWSPEEIDVPAVKAYIERLKRDVAQLI
ncbi:MAG: WbuC family cupin fold metalloprotein [Limisphaerales bacterium]